MHNKRADGSMEREDASLSPYLNARQSVQIGAKWKKIKRNLGYRMY